MGDGADSAEETDLVRYAVAAPMPAGAEAPPAPKVRVCVRKADIIKYGMTAGCQGCAEPRRRGATPHSLQCRARIRGEVERDGGRVPRRTLKTVTIYPVVPNSPALPRWVQSVHASHQVILVGGVAGCLRCGRIVFQMRYVLKKPCDGCFRASKAKWRRLCQGRLPSKLKKWPDELATPTDVRPVDHLRYAGSEWVRGSQVAIALAFADAGRTFPSVSPRKVSWDPYPFPQA